MKLKLHEIFEMKDPMIRLSNEKLPLKVAYKLSRLIKGMDDHLQTINDEREKLFNSMAEEADGQLTIPVDKVPDFNAQWHELLQEEVEMEVPSLDIDELSHIELSAQDMLKVEVLFED